MLILKIIEINIWQENSFGLQKLCRIEKNDTAFFVSLKNILATIHETPRNAFSSDFHTNDVVSY